MFAGFTTQREPPCSVCARLQTALNGFADTEIFILHPRSDGHALLVVFKALLADVPEIEIEDDTAVIDINWDHEIRVHVTLVAVDHQVGILPEIPGAMAFTRGSSRRIF